MSLIGSFFLSVSLTYRIIQLEVLSPSSRLTQADNIYSFIMQNFCDMVSMNKIVISYDAINRLQFSGMTGYHEKSFSGF